MQSDSLQLIEVYSNLKLGKEQLSGVTRIHSFDHLDQILKSPFSESYSLVVVGGEISPLFLHQWLKKNSSLFEPRLKIIYVYDFLTKADIILLSECSAVFKIIQKQDSSEVWQKSWQEAVASFSSLLATKDIMGRVRAQNKVLNELNENLEKIIEQRTYHLEISKKEIEIKNKEIRELIKFIKSLSNVEAFEDLLLILKHEFIRYHKVEPPIMVYSLYPHSYRCIYFQGPQIIDRNIDKIKIENFLNDPLKLREALAEILARPVGPILSVTIERKDHSGYFIFEHSMDSLEQKIFLEILERRIESLRVSFDRLALKWKAHLISRQWSLTFDSLLDPIAIVDQDSQLIRANKSFSQVAPYLKKAKTGKVNINGQLFQVHAYPIQLAPGEKSIHTIVHCTDITQSTKLQGQIIQSEKMAALGLLAGNIAHELNNPLTGIKSLAQILISEVGPLHMASADLSEIEQAAQRSEMIIKNLLDFSSLHESKKERVSLSQIVHKTLPFLKTTMRYCQNFIELDEKDDFIDVEPQLLQQVIFNLVNNACQAMEEKGELTLTSRVNDRSVEFSVRDTGPGVPVEIREVIFTPFFTTKEEGHGTGLGLSMSRSIIEKFGGKLYLNENTTEGSEFIISLPKAVQ